MIYTETIDCLRSLFAATTFFYDTCSKTRVVSKYCAANHITSKSIYTFNKILLSM